MISNRVSRHFDDCIASQIVWYQLARQAVYLAHIAQHAEQLMMQGIEGAGHSSGACAMKNRDGAACITVVYHNNVEYSLPT